MNQSHGFISVMFVVNCSVNHSLIYIIKRLLLIIFNTETCRKNLRKQIRHYMYCDG
jgi:hypothetical protein